MRPSARLRDETIVVMQPTEDWVGHEVAFVCGGLGFSESGIRIWDASYPLVNASSVVPVDHLG
jgi:hypothetical protein